MFILENTEKKKFRKMFSRKVLDLIKTHILCPMNFCCTIDSFRESY